MFAQEPVKGVLGVGVPTYEDQKSLITSSGRPLERTRGAWHLEMSEYKHAFLTRRGGVFVLVLKAFEDKNGRLEPAKSWVELDRQQATDFVFASPDLIATCRRNDVTQVSKKILHMLHGSFNL